MTWVGNVADHVTDTLANTSDNVGDISVNAADHCPDQGPCDEPAIPPDRRGQPRPRRRAHSPAGRLGQHIRCPASYLVERQAEEEESASLLVNAKHVCIWSEGEDERVIDRPGERESTQVCRR